MKRLERKRARRCILLAAASVLSLMSAFISGDISSLWFVGSFGVCVVCAILAGSERMSELRCPYCGKGMAPVRWKPGRQQVRCPCCSQLLLYDDEEPAEK